VTQLRAGLAYARRVGNRVWEEGLSGQTYVFYVLGEWDEILALRSSVSDPQTASLRAFNTTVGLFTLVHVQRGELDEARRLHGWSPEMETSGDVQERAYWLLGKALIASAEGDDPGAMAVGKELLALSREFGPLAETTKEGWIVTVEAAIRSGDLTTARELLDAFDALPSGRRSRYLEGHAARFRARLADDPTDADRRFAEAAERFRELEAAFWLAATKLEHAERLTADGRRDDARPLLDDARPTLERLSARPWLERADAAERLVDHSPAR